jgi:glycosyltransferase involved in cell wall biosynthesis
MIYVCIPSYNEAPTVGLLLWKVRQVFAGFPREYQMLVLDDGSDDATAEVLERYTRVLPLTVIRHQTRRGYAASVEELLRQAVDRTDRPKRDAAILMHADFAHGPNFIPDLVRRIESGADIVIA